jgi:hypothetical protein
LAWPVGHVVARTPAPSTLSAPGTVARAAFALGATETGRDDPANPLGAAGVTGAAGLGDDLAGSAHRAPGAGAGGSS